MAERFRLKVNVTNQDICRGCPLSETSLKNIREKGNTVTSKVETSYTCRLAVFEKRIKRIPNFSELEDGINSIGAWKFNVPNGCPNQYINISKMPITLPKR